MGEAYATYVSDVVASTSAKASDDKDPSAGISAQLGWLVGIDLAILRLRTGRRFAAAPLHTGSTEGIRDRTAVAVSVVPKMYPHRNSVLLLSEHFGCPGFVDGNSGSPIFADGQVVGGGTSVHMSPGPKKLQEFIRERGEIWFLLEEPDSSASRP